MTVNADITLITILEYKQIFFEMIDYADATGVKGSDEFTIPHYNGLLSDLLKGMKPADRARLADTLRLENLSRNGLLAYLDEKSDRFLLQPFVLDMLRHLDNSRLRELSDTELNGLQVQLTDVLNLVSSESFPWWREDVDFKEKLAFILDSVRNTASRIQQNIESLRGQSRRLAKIIDQNGSEPVSRSMQVHDALAKIFEITERHINPTLTFLNPSLDWKGSGNYPPMKIIHMILERFERRGFNDEYNMISRTYWNLLNAGEQISSIRKNLDVYIRLHESQRKLYNRIEERYNDLASRVKALQDGKRKGNRIKSSDAHFDISTRFHGLKVYQSTYQTCINWPKDMGRVMLDEHLRIRLDAYRDRAQKTARDAKTIRPVSRDALKARKRMGLLKAAADKVRVETSKDIYSQIHDQLPGLIDDYQLTDLLDILPFIHGAEIQVNVANRRRIKHQSKELHYFERHLPEKASL